MRISNLAIVAAISSAIATTAAHAAAYTSAVEYFNQAAGTSLGSLSVTSTIPSLGGGYSDTFTWNNVVGSVIKGNGTVVADKTIGTAEGVLQVGPNPWLTWNVSVVANVLVSNSVNFVAIGLINSGSTDFGNLGQISLRLYSNGSYQLYGLTNQTAAGQFDPNVYNTFELRQNIGSYSTVSLYINGVEVVTNQGEWQANTNGGSWNVKNYNAIAYRIDGDTDQSAAINYIAYATDVSDVNRPSITDAVPTPEPASLGVLALAGAGLLLGRRSRK